MFSNRISRKFSLSLRCKTLKPKQIMSKEKFKKSILLNIEEEKEMNESIIEILSCSVFDFHISITEMEKYYVKTMMEVIESISGDKTFPYANKNTNEYIAMINTHFLHSKIEWGTSVLGCWFHTYDDIYIFDIEIKEGSEDIQSFMAALVDVWNELKPIENNQ